MTERDTNTLAVRAMVGWHWMWGDDFFVSLQLGASIGYEFGEATIEDQSVFPASRSTAEPLRSPAAFASMRPCVA